MNPTNLDRRRLLAGGAGVLAAASFGGLARAQTAAAPAAATAKPLPPYVSWKDPNSVIVHTATTIETKRTAFGSSLITPANRLYIRNNLPAPDVSIVADRDGWAVSVEGVRQPRTLTVARLEDAWDSKPSRWCCNARATAAATSDQAERHALAVGAAGCVFWSGVPVRAVVGRWAACRRRALHDRHGRRSSPTASIPRP